MKKVQKLLISTLCVAMGACALVACGDDTTPGNTPSTGGSDKCTVTFYDATGTTKPADMTVLKTVEVTKGETVESYTPTKDGGYDFVNWFATPSKSHAYDFSEGITENVSIYGGFSKYQEDTRSYYIVGSGTSTLLLASNWGNVITDDHKMVKAADKNEYTITCDLKNGDEFQFAIDTTWANQRGYGYLATVSADGVEMFGGNGSAFSESAKTTNIKCLYDGNYTFTLTTYPADDYYNENGTNYTEERKENYNMGTYDRITWVRNGDIQNATEVVTDYYIKGSEITGWQNVYISATKMISADGVYTLSVYLKEGEEFLFVSTNTVGDTVSDGTIFLRSLALDEASKEYLDETATKNMVAKRSGTYTFTYTQSTEVLSVTFDETKVPVPTDYYIDGTFADGVADWSGYCFQSAYKLTETSADSGVYEIKNVNMKAGSEFIIQAFKAGSTERGEWGTDGYNGLGSYNSTYVVGGGDKFVPVSATNKNIKVVEAGTYDITFDSYTKILTIKAHVA